MNIAKMMQAAQSMKTKMAEMQARLAQEQVTGTAAGGAVAITMNGRGYVDAVAIRADALDPSDPAMLEDMVKIALNDARRRVDDTMESETRKLMESLGLPPGMQLPF